MQCSEWRTHTGFTGSTSAIWRLTEHTVPVQFSQTCEPRAGRKYEHRWETWDRKPETCTQTNTQVEGGDSNIIMSVPPSLSQTCEPEAEKTA